LRAEGKTWHCLTAEETAAELAADLRTGLEAGEAARRLKEQGPNEWTEKGGRSSFALLLDQFRDFMVLVLAGAAVISAFLGEILDAITILAIILLNGLLGFFQEYRAEKSLQALKELSAPTARVMRGGEILRVPARELVRGDLVLLESGDRVPADLRLVAVNGLAVEEAALTGESVPVSKRAEPIAAADVPLGDRRNMAYLGTMVVKGSARGIVVETGAATEMGKIADLIQNAETGPTPLQHRLEQLGKILIALSVALTVVVVVAGVLHGQPLMDMFLAGVSLAVAAIPEGLPAVVTIALALGVQRMIRRRAIVRKLPSVETLGCATVICSDKTGTLTLNKMTVTRLWLEGRTLEVTGTGYVPSGQVLENGRPADARKDAALRRLAQAAALCNNARLEQEGNGWQVRGDPTEGALLVLAAKAGWNRSAAERMYEREREFPFDSARKRMSVIVRHQGGRLICAKGAPDVLVDRCSYVLWGGNVLPLTPTIRRKVLQAAEEMAGQALRVLGFAYRDLASDENPAGDDEAETGLVFVGLAGMIDPPRREAAEAIRKCRLAGIRTVMITGDHRATAEAIARELGILSRGGAGAHRRRAVGNGRPRAGTCGGGNRRIRPRLAGTQAAHRPGFAAPRARGGDDGRRGERRSGGQDRRHRHRHGRRRNGRDEGSVVLGAGR